MSDIEKYSDATFESIKHTNACLLYTSDAADE